MVSPATVALSTIAFLASPPALLQQEDDDTFFSGTLDEVTPESIAVKRDVPGSPPERRTFTINAQTKVEGKLAEGARVTVKFRIVDEGSLAETIIVRDPPKGKKKP